MVEVMVTNLGRAVMHQEEMVIMERQMGTKKMGTCRTRWERRIVMVIKISMSPMSRMKRTERRCLFLVVGIRTSRPQ
jgi:hypothetical protein